MNMESRAAAGFMNKAIVFIQYKLSAKSGAKIFLKNVTNLNSGLQSAKFVIFVK